MPILFSSASCLSSLATRGRDSRSGAFFALSSETKVEQMLSACSEVVQTTRACPSVTPNAHPFPPRPLPHPRDCARSPSDKLATAHPAHTAPAPNRAKCQVECDNGRKTLPASAPAHGAESRISFPDRTPPSDRHMTEPNRRREPSNQTATDGQCQCPLCSSASCSRSFAMTRSLFVAGSIVSVSHAIPAS